MYLWAQRNAALSGGVVLINVRDALENLGLVEGFRAQAPPA